MSGRGRGRARGGRPPVVVVVGAGPNGLAAAALLARGGRRVVLLERRGRAGGLAVGPASAGDGSPAFAGPLVGPELLRPAVARELELERHGLVLRSAPPDVLLLDGGGGSLLLPGDGPRAEVAVASWCAADAEAWREMRARLVRFRAAVDGFLDGPAPPVAGPPEPGSLGKLLAQALRVRRLGGGEMLELLRLPPMSVADALAEWLTDPLLRAGLALPALAGGVLGPRAPGTAFAWLLREAAGGVAYDGGGPALAAALEHAARAAGVELRTGTEVAAIDLDDAGAVAGVRLAGGEPLPARTVVAACDPRRALLALLPRGALASRTERRARAWRCRGSTAQVLCALAAAPPFFSAAASAGVARLAGHPDEIERAADAVKYGRLPERPVLELVRGGEGGTLLSIAAHFVPYDLDGGWDDAARERVATAVFDRLEPHWPSVGSDVTAWRVLSPVDVEAVYGVTGGQIQHGEPALDQLLGRPFPECANHRTPIPGLWLCGPGTHPGGGLTCAPAMRLARQAKR